MSANLTPNYDPDLAYKGGWVTVGLIRRPLQKLRVATEVEPPDPDIVCDTCEARYWQACTSAAGRPVRSHDSRTGPRTCICRKPVTGSRNYCGTCDQRRPK